VIYIDFFGGLHGNFLCYAVNALDDQVKKQNPFTQFGTSHVPYNKPLAQSGHYSLLDQPIAGTDIIALTADPRDCLLVNLLAYSRSADYKFDLKNFNVNFYDQIKDTKFSDMIDKIDHSYGLDLARTNSLPRGTLREYLKFGFIDYNQNGMIQEIVRQQYTVPVFEVDFKKLYQFNSFLDTIENINRHFDLGYTVDSGWYHTLWQQFIVKIDAIKWDQDCHTVLDAVENQRPMQIDFNIVQEAWLNARLEVLYNVEMPFLQEQYFANTQEIIRYIHEI